MRKNVWRFALQLCLGLVVTLGSACVEDDSEVGDAAPQKHAPEDEHDHAEKKKGHDKESPGHGQDEDASEQHDENGNDIVELTEELVDRIGIKVAPVERRLLPSVLHTTGKVDFDERRLAHVSPRIPGRVKLARAELGDDVSAGSILATLDSIQLGEAKVQYLSARSEESLARKTHEREKRLLKDRITSEQTVLEAMTYHEQSLVHLRSAEEKLRLLGLSDQKISKVRFGDPKASLFPLIAPFKGRVVEKHLVIGELVTPEDNAFTIADLSVLWIWIDVYEQDLARVHPDDLVTVVTRAYPNRIFEGKVSYVQDQLDPVIRVARARIDIGNPDGALKAGMFVKVTLVDPHTGAEHAREGLAVPISAIQRDGSRDVAFVKVDDRRFEQRTLKLGLRSDPFVEVLDGLALGELVVTNGTFILKSEVAKEEMGGGHSH